MAQFRTKEGEIFDVPDEQLQIPGMMDYLLSQGYTPTMPQTAISPQAIAQPAPQINPNDPQAAIAALKQYRAGIPGGGSDVGAMDAFIQGLERGAAAGQDQFSLAQQANAGLQVLQQWKDPDALSVLRGEITGETRRGNLLEGLQKQTQAGVLPFQKAQEKQEFESLAGKQAQESEALRQSVLGQIPGLQEQMGQELLKQQQYAYSQISPQIEARLNAMGLLQSGALPEAQQKAFKELEMARQARLSDFGQQARQQLAIDMPFTQLYGTQGLRRESLQGGIDLTRAGIQRGYQEQDWAQQYALQRELSRQALEEARSARNQANKTAMWQTGIGAVGNILGGATRGYAGG